MAPLHWTHCTNGSVYCCESAQASQAPRPAPFFSLKKTSCQAESGKKILTLLSKIFWIKTLVKMILTNEITSKCQKLYKFFASNHEFVMIWYVCIIVYFTKDYINTFFHNSSLNSNKYFLLFRLVIIGSIDLRKWVSRWIFVTFKIRLILSLFSDGFDVVIIM